MRSRSKFFWPALVLMTALFTMTTVAAYAAVSTDQYYYNYGDTVQIAGDGMQGGEAVFVDVSYPDGSLAQHHEVQADDNGNFSDSFYLADGMPPGIYGVLATGQSSGNVYTTEFDPTNASYDGTFDSSGLPATVQYSDTLSFSGTISCTEGTNVNNGPCEQVTSDILIQLKIGANWTDVASTSFTSTNTGPHSYSEPWTVTWQAGRDLANLTVDPGTYDVRARASSLHGNPWTSSPQGIADGVVETKEDTTTTYNGDTSGLPGGTLHLSPSGTETTVADSDGGSGAGNGIFSPDTNLAGSNVVHFSLYDGACPLGGSPTQEGSTVNANLDSSGKVTGTPSLTLPSTAGSYCLKTAYDGNTYYKSSADYDAITVTQPCTYTATFLQPLDGSTPSMFIGNTVKRGRVIPVKVTIQDSCDGYVTDTSGNAVTISVTNANFVPKATDAVETYSDAGSSSGQTTAFRWVTDATVAGGGYWIYNLDTSGFSVSTSHYAYVYVDSTKVLTNYAIVTTTK